MSSIPSQSPAFWQQRWAQAGGEIGFLLLPKFSMLELFCAVDSLRIANRLGQAGFGWTFLSLDGGPVVASNGVEIAVAGRFGQAPPPPVLFVVASYEPEAKVTAHTRNELRRLARHGVLLGALDTGAFVLARANLLDGRRVTLHWEAIAAFAEDFPEIEVTSSLYELDRDRLTCSGGSAVIDMMLSLIALQRGEELARAVAEQIIHPRMRSGTDAQRMTPTLRYRLDHPKVAKAIDLMERHLDQPLPLAEVAVRAGLSQRQLERLCRAHLGRTAKSFYVGLRLERARQLLVDSRITVTAAALGAGFESAAHFSRAFRRAFGHPPSAARGLGARSAPARPSGVS